jgi:hypothetical protein
MYIVQKQIENRWENEANCTMYEVALCKVLELMRDYNTRVIKEKEGTVIYYERVR